MIDGYKNTVTKAEHVSVIGSENTVENSKSQTVIGDSNKITDRNAGTVSGKQEERTKNVSDLVIGKGNKIEGNSTYMKGYESLTVIGNNNEMVNPGAGIVIGDNQKVGAIKESVVIGSMTPEEKADSDIRQKHASVVVGYHAQSGTRDGGGMNVALGHGAKAYGWQETVTGIKSIVEAGDSGYDGYLASVYGGLNTVASNKADQNDGMANTVVGTLNKTEGANGALVFGAGNSVTHSFGTAPTDENGNSMNEYWGDTILFQGQGYAGGTGQLSHDEIRKAMGLAMSTGGGSVVTMGNGNTSDYAVHSQIIGSGNILTGTANTPSINNTINGYGNTGTNVERVSMMGTGNNMSGSTADVVIGDYHHKDGGKNNVILGSMATEKKAVEKTYTMKDASGNVIREKKYKVTENVPIKSHTANISNAVMLGYNTDVEKDGGVALGADSIASVDKGVEGYDPAAGNHANDTTGTWKATAAAVSVGKAADPTGAAGSPAITRQITNVAAGTQDTDAVNVAQLKAVQTAADASKVHYYSVNDKGYHVGNYNNDGAKGGMALAAGAGAAANGTASTVTGAFSRVDGDGVNGFTNGFQGATSSVYGTFNVVGAKNGVKFDGVANSIVGVANKTENANAALIFGAGNKVTNSYRPVTGSVSTLSQAMQKALNTGDNSDMITALGEMTKTSGGAVLAIGGANTADYAQLSKLVGVGNTLTGTNGHESLYNMIDGYLNTGKNINYVTVIGSENEVEDTDDALVMGNKRKLSNHADNSIVLGSGDSTITTSVANAVAIGHNANVTAAGGVALGFGSIASTAAGAAGYDPKTGGASSDASSTWKATQAAVSVGDAANNVTRQITGVAAGAQDTDAVNVAQLKQVQSTATTAANMEVKGGNNVTVDKTTAGPDNHTVYTVNSKDTYTTGGTYDAATKKLKFTQNDASKNYEVDVSGLVNGISHDVNKGINFAGDTGAAINRKMGETLQITGGATEVATANNIGVVAEDGKLNLKLAKNIDLGSDGSVKTGNTKVSNTGVTIAGGPSMTTTGIDAGSKKITHVAAGEVSSTSTDAVNGSQLHAVKNDVQNITNNVTNISGKVNKLDNRLDRVGAGAAALAALHPLDFDPDDKWDFAAGYGNYRGANAMSVGAFYRPNEDTMLSVGGSFGGGENMVNAGISLKLGQGNHVSTSKVAMAKEIKDLRQEVEQLKGALVKMSQGQQLDTTKMKLFPDVPENHWAYEYVATLAGNDVVEGYPDGNFGGDRMMTRYEFAAIVYRAMQRGVNVDARMLAEFEPELERFRVDTIAKDKAGNPSIERVRVISKKDKK
ncbi:S-layer homology domain-containing protein [Colibacter massiliensis]|uniref:S-layer homology domain-containing protein n=1 Tax=Colibacter massiliensis TaxID=1852379 RepID=UPI003F8FE081